MKTFEEFVKEGWYSEDFYAGYDPESYAQNKALSERQLFTQSNARVLLGQDNMGRFHFIAAPHRKDYALPTRKTGAHQHITACPGMYYQTDLTLFLGKAWYEMKLEDGSFLRNGNEDSVTRYLNDFLPWTVTQYEGLELNTISLAPVLEKPMRGGMKTLPLPGPSGAFYGMNIKNTGKKAVKLTVSFHFENLFMSKYEHCNEPVETRAFPAVYSQVDRNLLLMQRPEGYTGIYMRDGIWEKDDQEWKAERTMLLEPGESFFQETLISVAETSDEVSEALGILFMHSIEEWMEITDVFWKDRLGELKVFDSCEQSLARKSRDIHIRNILDNFNCVQTDENGRVLVHWQGAPSHCFGRMWGIDVEPTTLSFLHILPEMGKRLIEYMADRNEPRYSEFPEHSVPIMMAPLIMAGEYLHDTGDVEYFRENTYVKKRLDEIWEKIYRMRHNASSLVPSRFSSDGIVMRRYDHGTNVKFWYASRCYGDILTALEESADLVWDYMEKLKRGIEQYMVTEGPFGPQISGGTNLGEQEEFYMNEDFCYYDGEDSSSVLAPVYGIWNYTYTPWKNYHRFARSIFCSNYDPEMDTLRWFPYGGALDGTAYISQAGGSITREEMRTSFANMISAAVDETGSLYWWPKAENKRRMIARCSQGQGAWVFQYIRQWLGIQINAEKKTLKIYPMGMLDGYSWENALLGNFRFDIHYREENGYAVYSVTNKNNETFQLILGCRSQGQGAGNVFREKTEELAPGKTVEARLEMGKELPEERNRIPDREAQELSDDGIVFGHFGFHQPSMDDVEKNTALLQFVLVNGKKVALEKVKLCIQAPQWMHLKEKEYRIWDSESPDTSCILETRECSVLPGTRKVFGIWTGMDKEYHADKIWFDKHPFWYGKEKEEGSLWVESDAEEKEYAVSVRLTYQLSGKKEEKRLLIPVRTVMPEKLRRIVRTFLGAVSE